MGLQLSLCWEQHDQVPSPFLASMAAAELCRAGKSTSRRGSKSALQLVEARVGWGAPKVCIEQIGLSAGDRPGNRCDSSD